MKILRSWLKLSPLKTQQKLSQNTLLENERCIAVFASVALQKKKLGAITEKF